MQKKQLDDSNTMWSKRKPLTRLDEIEKKYMPTDSHANQFSPVEEPYHKKEKVSPSCSLFGLFPGCFQVDTDEEEAANDTRSTLAFYADSN